MTYLLLFYEFFKTGLFAIGGGMATIPFLMEIAKKYPWFTTTDLTNMIAISESTPGPIGINVATYAGFAAKGVPGALIATLSLVLPSYLIICIISFYLKKYKDSDLVQSAFSGIRPAVVALISYAVLQVLLLTLFTKSNGTMKLNIIPCIITIVMFALMNVKKIKNIHPLVWIVCGAVLGIIFKL